MAKSSARTSPGLDRAAVGAGRWLREGIQAATGPTSRELLTRSASPERDDRIVQLNQPPAGELDRHERPFGVPLGHAALDLRVATRPSKPAASARPPEAGSGTATARMLSTPSCTTTLEPGKSGAVLW